MPEPMALDDRQAWKADALAAIEARAKSGEPFTADDLRDDGLREPPVDKMWGPLFPAARRLGIIRKVGHTESRRKLRAHGVHAVWVGTTDTQFPQLAA